ncbi:MAG: hypothetical protein IJX48_05970 [Paludibacteraceae bacterium]|nr:hypothetical protein [Paludibacteraceae bacterium]
MCHIVWHRSKHKLVTVAEDYTEKSFPVAVFNVGQEDGSLSTTWTTAPNILFNTLGNGAASFDVKACKKGVWVTSNRSTGNNTSLYTSMRFYTWDGICTWSSHEHTDVINGNLGAGIAITPDESQIIMKIHDNTIAIFDLTWDATKEDATPILTLNASFDSGYAAVSSINLDYAGNIVTVAGTNFGNTDTQRMSLVVYSNPTNNNTCEVPAKKSSVVTKVAASATLYTVVTNVNDVAMGEVTGNAGTYEEGATATLTAEPAIGYQFVNWTVGEETYTTNPLEIVVNSDLTVTANFEAISYTITANVNKEGYGEVTGGGAYDYNTSATLTATANEGYEFVNWSNGSKENPLTITVKGDETLTANFRAVLPESMTLNALPVVDYSATIVGTIKRAVQNGENTIVLSHEDNGTPHIYNVAHATKTVTEISQEGVNAAADGFLAISDIAVTEDGKLVACNYVHCTFTPSNTSYFYIWNDLAAAPSVWFTSQKSGNYIDAYMGYTMALKGTSQNAEVTISAFNKSNSNTRYSHLYVVDGTYSDASYKYSRDNAALHPNTLGKNTYELNASPLAAGKWILDGELTSPIEFVEQNAVAIDTYTALNSDVLGKKYNGATYLANYNEHHLMVAPYANGEGYLAGVKVVDIVDGFAAATELTTNTDLATAENATAAAATAVVDAEGKLTIHLFSDAKVYTFTQKEQGPTTALDNTTVAPQVQKIIRDGQVLIIRDGKTFNMMGQEVR